MRSAVAFEAVLFDIGGVLIEQDDLWPAAARSLGAPDDAALRELAQAELRAACRGECSLRDAWRRVASRLGTDPPDETLERLWVDDYPAAVRPRSELTPLLSDLAARHALGIVSDTVPQHSAVLAQLGLFAPFREVVLSYEVGLTKDSPAIFELALQRLGARAERTIFVDDLASNVETARRAGLVGVVYRSADGLREALASLGALP